ncbi:LytR C-terminal domain-containing protein [Frankia sp. AvcI1]|uniref:LytR C-terminal domain-containing protein n=1 Tax=Frankia sp. AvcI1 TaxID=573496 RepID=UPI001F1FAC8A|nr:LytR C-terminal domain-containing protein [Frankia sp. AvcI1]
MQFYRPDDLLRIVNPLGGRVEGATTSGDAGAGAGPSLAPGATAAPSQVRVTVYNGSSRSGLASQVTAALTRKGFHARNAGNASALTHVTSRVIYGPGQEAEARTVAAAVPGSSVLADSSVTGVQLVLGSGFTEVVTPAVSSGTGTSSANPAPAAGGTTAGDATAGATPAVQGPTAPPEAPTCTY